MLMLRVAFLPMKTIEGSTNHVGQSRGPIRRRAIRPAGVTSGFTHGEREREKERKREDHVCLFGDTGD